MKQLLILGLILLSAQSFARSDKGNGGSASEAQMIAQQAQIESVAFKIRSFFLKNEATLKSQFPEFEIQTLVKKIKTSDIRIVDEEFLYDKNGVSRTCLNFPDSSLIECKYSGIQALLNGPAPLFVLVLHEYLGLIGAEETAPTDPNIVDGYSISKRIAPYVTKVNDYDLVMTSSSSPKARTCDILVLVGDGYLTSETNERIEYELKERNYKNVSFSNNMKNLKNGDDVIRLDSEINSVDSFAGFNFNVPFGYSVLKTRSHVEIQGRITLATKYFDTFKNVNVLYKNVCSYENSKACYPDAVAKNVLSKIIAKIPKCKAE